MLKLAHKLKSMKVNDVLACSAAALFAINLIALIVDTSWALSSSALCVNIAGWSALIAASIIDSCGDRYENNKAD